MALKVASDIIGNTPLVSLKRLLGDSRSQLLAKLETINPTGSFKDRVVKYMLDCAEFRGEIVLGDTLIEATSGNMGIALAMTCIRRGYRVILVIPPGIPKEMRSIMTAFGAELISVPDSSGIEAARSLAKELEQQGVGKVLDQFSSEDNPEAHYRTTGPELWEDSEGSLTHFVCGVGTSGTIVGVGHCLKERNSDIKVIGVRPVPDGKIPGLQNWQPGDEPDFFDFNVVDEIVEVTPELAAEITNRLIFEEGLFAGISSGASIAVGLRLCRRLNSATVATIICDRGDRYLSTGVFN